MLLPKADMWVVIEVWALLLLFLYNVAGVDLHIYVNSIYIYYTLGYHFSRCVCSRWEAIPNHFAGAKLDLQIRRKFGLLFHIASLGIFYPLCYWNCGNCVQAHVILWDQVSRHLYRNNMMTKEYWNLRGYRLAAHRIDYLKSCRFEISMIDRWCFIAVRHYLNLDGNFNQFEYSNLIEMQGRVEKVWHSVNQATQQSFLKIMRNSYDGEMFELFHDATETANYINSVSKKEFVKLPLVKSVINSVKEIPDIENETCLGVSLSGGCDSMACLIAVILLHQFGYLPNLKKIAVIHINYQQRKLAKKEADFLQEYVETLNKTIDSELTITINVETCRPVTDFASFSEYDKHATATRFDAYKSSGARFIIVGHNIGDVLENILQNIFNVGSVVKSSVLDLCGMTRVSARLGSQIFRPLLMVEKDEIKRFCEVVHIPFFYDSSNPNCTRIKIRRVLVDSLVKVFGEKVIYNAVRNFYKKCELYRMFIQNINKKLLKSVQDHGSFSVLNITDVDDTKFFCMEQLSVILNTYTPLHPSHKSLIQLWEYLKSSQAKNIRLFNLNEKIPIYVVIENGKSYLIMVKEIDVDGSICLGDRRYKISMKSGKRSLTRQ